MSIEQSFERIAAALERLAFVANEFLVAAGGRATAAPSDLPGLTVAQAEARPAPPTAVATVGALPQQAPPPRGRGRPAKVPTTEQTPPAATPAAAAPATAPAAVAAPATPGVSSPTVLTELSEKIQILANTPGKLQVAIGILKSRHGAQRVSELKPEEYESVLAEVKAALNTTSLI